MRFRISCLFIATLLGACGAPNDPYAVSEAFWTATIEGDLELARSYMDLEGRSTVKAASEWPEGNFSFGETVIEGDGATVETTLFSEGPIAMEIPFKTVLVREDDDWKVAFRKTMDEMGKGALANTADNFLSKFGR